MTTRTGRVRASGKSSPPEEMLWSSREAGLDVVDVVLDVIDA
jgi:hypothetical protein